MTVILVLLTFLVFILIDYAISVRSPAPAPAKVPAQAAPPSPDLVEGFLVPSQLDYHPAHSWVLRERPHVHRVGLDQFGAAILGKIDSLQLPKPGQWIRQGQRAFSFFRDGQKSEALSPVEGEVIEVNAQVQEDPGLLRWDPYGAGWLMVVHAPDEESPWRNLLPKNLVRAWMREAAARLYAFQPQTAGASLADGGLPVEDPLGQIPGISWERATRELLRSTKESYRSYYLLYWERRRNL